jgi:hypothetical protein
MWYNNIVAGLYVSGDAGKTVQVFFILPQPDGRKNLPQALLIKSVQIS